MAISTPDMSGQSWEMWKGIEPDEVVPTNIKTEQDIVMDVFRAEVEAIQAVAARRNATEQIV